MVPDFFSVGSIIGAILVLATSTTAAGFISALFQRRRLAAETGKTDAEAIHVLSQTAVSMIAPLKTQVDELSAKLNASNQQIDQLSASLGKANGRIRDLEFQVDVMTNRLNQANKSLTDQGLNPF